MLRALCVATPLLVAACATGADPLPARAPTNPVPREVAEHPGFYVNKGQPIEVGGADRKPAPKEDALCARACPAGEHCEVVHGLDTCVPDVR